MEYKIILDSCGELTEEMKADPHFASVPLILTLDGEEIPDDENFDQASFIKKMKESSEAPKSASPSPEKFYNEYMSGPKEFFVVTLSANLSSSYTSAQMGAQMALEENPDLKIHVFNSISASPAETLIGRFADELKRKGASFEEVVEQGEAYIKRMSTFFVLDNLDVFRKSGRLTGVKSVMTSALKLRPIMAGSDVGTIFQADIARGTKKALERMVELAIEKMEASKPSIIGITHCNCPERAELVKNAIAKKVDGLEYQINNARGVSTMYANDGGVILSF